MDHILSEIRSLKQTHVKSEPCGIDEVDERYLVGGIIMFTGMALMYIILIFIRIVLSPYLLSSLFTVL